MIWGSGNDNGYYTGVRQNGIKLGIRGNMAYQQVYNYVGNDTYEFDSSDGTPPPGRSLFNWDWSINVDWDKDNPTGYALDDLTYRMDIDYDPTVGTDFTSFDPINIPCADHGIGTNGIANDGGTEYSCSQPPTLTEINNVAQNSWNLGFSDLLHPGFDPQTEGLSTIGLSAFSGDGETLLASTSVDIRYGDTPAVPLPATLPLLVAALGGAGFLARRRKS